MTTDTSAIGHRAWCHRAELRAKSAALCASTALARELYVHLDAADELPPDITAYHLDGLIGLIEAVARDVHLRVCDIVGEVDSDPESSADA